MLSFKAANLALPNVAHAFFGRQGGVSDGIYESLNCGPGSKDSRDAVMENRRRALAALALGARLVTLYQMFGSHSRTPASVAVFFSLIRALLQLFRFSKVFCPVQVRSR